MSAITPSIFSVLVRLDIPRRIGANEDIVCHPAHDGMPAVRYFLFQCQLHQFLRRRTHILEALTEGNNGESPSFEVLHHLHRAPSVESNLTDVYFSPSRSMNASINP